MSMNIAQGDSDEDQSAMSEINVTPLVDVMLVLLIIFLITVPVVRQDQPVQLPSISNIETHSKPENIVLTIVENGDVWEGTRKFENPTKLRDYILSRVRDALNSKSEQPEVHIKADKRTLYASVGRTIMAVSRGGVIKVQFITEPPARQ